MAATAMGRARTQQPLSVTKRKSLATERLLGAVAGTGKDVVLTAALEAVNERLAWDAAFQRSFQQKVEELGALAPSREGAAAGRVPKPKPAAAAGSARFNPLAKLNPYEMADRYEHSQLRTVLADASQALLREAVDVVQSHEPGTKPVSRNKKADMVDYIMEHVLGPGH